MHLDRVLKGLTKSINLNCTPIFEFNPRRDFKIGLISWKFLGIPIKKDDCSKKGVQNDLKFFIVCPVLETIV